MQPANAHTHTHTHTSIQPFRAIRIGQAKIEDYVTAKLPAWPC